MKVLLLLGGNQGNVKKNLNLAIQLLSQSLGNIINSSGLYQSEPWGFESQQLFINQVLEFQTPITPFELLSMTQSIEKLLGREKKAGTHYEDRPIDIDILFCDDLIIHSTHLTLPHPLLHERRFTLEPLSECWAEFIHPVFKKSIRQLLNECEDGNQVKKLN